MVVIKLQTWNKDEGRKKETHGGNKVPIYFFLRRDRRNFGKGGENQYFLERKWEGQIKNRRKFLWRRATNSGNQNFSWSGRIQWKKRHEFFGGGQARIFWQQVRTIRFFLGKRGDPKFPSSK